MKGYTVPFVIDGKELYAKQSFDVVSPASGEVVHHVGIATEEEVNAAVEAAAAAGRQWRNTTPATRRDILLMAAEIMEARRGELAQYMVDEVAANLHWANFNLDVTIDMLKDTAGHISSLAGSVPALADPTCSSMILREPYGVVLAIAPW